MPLLKLSLLRSTGSSKERRDPLPPDSPPSIDTWSSTDEASPALPVPSICNRSFSRLASLDDVFDVGNVPTSPVDPLPRRSLSELREREFLFIQHILLYYLSVHLIFILSIILSVMPVWNPYNQLITHPPSLVSLYSLWTQQSSRISNESCTTNENYKFLTLPKLQTIQMNHKRISCDF